MKLSSKMSQLFGRAPTRVQQHNQELLRSLLVMAWMVEARDPYTGGHLWRVSRLSRLLASELALPAADVARIALGAFLHDLGKVAVPDAILNKAGPLNEEEFQVIKTHPEAGWRMLAGHPLAWLAETTIRSHHERPDGGGYPRGLAGEDIPLDARIVGICDAFDAMTSNRAYRRGMPVARALAIIEQHLGTQFDREAGRVFLHLGQAGALDHIVGHSDDGIPLHDCLMCGPTLVMQKQQQPGEHAYCRSCSAEYVIEDDGGQHRLTATGRRGQPGQLSPEADTELIARIVRESAEALVG